MSVESALAKCSAYEARTGVASPCEPVERVHPHPHPADARPRDLEPSLDRLVVADPDRNCPGVDGDQRVFPAPRSLDHWASRAVLGETHWAARKQKPIPARHRVAPLVLSVISAAGLPFLVWGLIVLDPWITAFGLVVQMAGKLWFLDRMTLLYDDVSSLRLGVPEADHNEESES